MKQSFICPCFNEEKNVIAFAKAVLDAFPNTKDYELVFINDGSRDNTIGSLKKLKKESTQNIKIINFSRNFGKESAMYAGLQNCKGDYITIIDTDLQQSPEIVKEMVDILENDDDIDCICACQENRHESSFAKFCKKNFYKFADKFTETHFVDGASDFRTFRSRVKDAILSMGEYYRFSKGIFSWVGFKTKWFDYENIERVAGTTKWNFWGLFKYSIEGIVGFSTTPLLIAAGAGVLFCILAFIGILFVVVRALMFGDPTSGWPSMVCIILLCSGVQLFCTGIVGEYLAKTYLEVKHRPIYIVAETEEDKK